MAQHSAAFASIAANSGTRSSLVQLQIFAAVPGFVKRDMWFTGKFWWFWWNCLCE